MKTTPILVLTLLVSMALFTLIACEVPSPDNGDPDPPIEEPIDDVLGTWVGLYDPMTWTFSFYASNNVTLFSDHPTNDDAEMSGSYTLDSQSDFLVVRLTDLVSGSPPFALPLAIAFSYTLSADGNTLTLYIVNLGGTIILTKTP